MNSTLDSSGKPASPKLFILFTVLTLILWTLPGVNILLAPVSTFVTTLHEMGHAIACLATGGSVVGMTVVSDGDGHGGLTMCQGGWPLIYTQTGYLGTAFAGCLLIWFSKSRERAKAVLIVLGIAIGVSSLWFLSQTIFTLHRTSEGAWSLAFGLMMAAALIVAGSKLRASHAQMLLTFLAVQTALNALTDVLVLIELSCGFQVSASFSDATNMQKMTHIPAAVWSVFWGLTSLVMLLLTVKFTYLRKSQPAETN